jgi:hypothetical protein
VEKYHRVHATRNGEDDPIMSAERRKNGLADFISFMSALYHGILI